MKSIFKFIRWGLVLPCSVIGFMGCWTFVVPENVEIPFPCIHCLTESFAGAVAAGAFVGVGAHVAPVHKKKTAFVLCVMYFIYSVYSIIDPYRIYEDYGIVKAIMYKVIGMAFCVYVYISTEDD